LWLVRRKRREKEGEVILRPGPYISRFVSVRRMDFLKKKTSGKTKGEKRGVQGKGKLREGKEKKSSQGIVFRKRYLPA